MRSSKGFFHCLACEKTFPADEAHTRSRRESYDIGDHTETVKQLLSVCCHCGSENLDELPACVECGQRLPVLGDDACQECIDELEERWRLRGEKLAKLRRLTAFVDELQREVA